MTNYQSQLQSVVDALRARQHPADGPHAGGWGALLEPKAPSSIVNTAEAIAVFALAGMRDDDIALQRGLQYLHRKVAVHPLPTGTHPEARGRKARYAAFGLMGLTAYSFPIEDREHSNAIAACVTWLECNVLHENLDADEHGQGWAEHPHVPRVSVLSTSIAARSLDKVPIGTPGAANSRALASNARRRLRRLARGDANQRWWPARSDADEALGHEGASAAVTAMAILALADGGTSSQEYARAGVRWLLHNTERWEQQRESEENIPDANWVYASAPLCLHAALVPCAGIDPERRDLAVAISYLDRLWSPAAGEWRHGHPSSDVSTSADLHAASAIRAMRRAWRGFDPVDHLLGGRPAKSRVPRHQGGDKPYEVYWSDGALTVRSAEGSVLAQRRFPSRATAMRALLDALTERWRAVGDEATLLERSLSATELRGITSITDIYEYVRRLNAAVTQASRDKRGRSCVLVQRIESGQGLERDRYALLGSRLLVD